MKNNPWVRLSTRIDMDSKKSKIHRYEHDPDADILRCPKCGSDFISDVTGWCFNYGEPLIEGECETGPDREMCCGFVYGVEDGFYCNDCFALFDYKWWMNHDDAIGQPYCPIGKMLGEIGEKYEPQSAYEINIERVKNLAKNKIYDMAIVALVSAFETYIKDNFIKNNSKWFEYLNSGIEKNRTILKVIDNCGVKEKYFDELFVIGKEGEVCENSTYPVLKRILFGSDSSPQYNRINFQNLQGKCGFNWAYKHFFGVDVNAHFSKVRLPRKKITHWKKLRHYFYTRHRIVHGLFDPEDLDTENINEAVQIVREIKSFIDEITKNEDEEE